MTVPGDTSPIGPLGANLAGLCLSGPLISCTSSGFKYPGGLGAEPPRGTSTAARRSVYLSLTPRGASWKNAPPEGATMTTGTKPPLVQGELARAAGMSFPLEVLQSRAGYYLGTRDAEGLPYSRESAEYWRQADQAASALEHGRWTQRREP